MKQKKGFTLIEILIVTLIVGTLAMVALPQYERAVLRSKAAEIWAILPTVRSAAQEYCLANGGGTRDIPVEDLSVDFPSNFKSTVFSCSNCNSFLSGYGEVSGALLLTNKDVQQVTEKDVAFLVLSQRGARACQGDQGVCKKLGFSKGNVYCDSTGCSSSGLFTE